MPFRVFLVFIPLDSPNRQFNPTIYTYIYIYYNFVFNPPASRVRLRNDKDVIESE